MAPPPATTHHQQQPRFGFQEISGLTLSALMSHVVINEQVFIVIYLFIYCVAYTTHVKNHKWNLYVVFHNHVWCAYEGNSECSAEHFANA